MFLFQYVADSGRFLFFAVPCVVHYVVPHVVPCVVPYVVPYVVPCVVPYVTVKEITSASYKNVTINNKVLINANRVSWGLTVFQYFVDSTVLYESILQ